MASPQMEMLVCSMKNMIAKGMPAFDDNIDPYLLRQTIEASQSEMPIEPGVAFIPDQLGSVEAEISMPKNARQDAIIFYIHGGGLICGNAFTSRGYASMLAGETRMPVYSLSYRLAPEHPYPAAVDDCYQAYAMIIDRYPELPVFLIGESGGGLLCLTTALKARDAGLRMPAGIIPYSPVIDMSDKIDRSANEGKDFTVTIQGLRQLREIYCPDPNLWEHPYVSPLYGDFTGFPPMLLAWDSTETLAADSVKLIEKAVSAGVKVEFKAYEGCFHAFPPAGRRIPESAEVLEDTVSFINRCTRKYWKLKAG